MIEQWFITSFEVEKLASVAEARNVQYVLDGELTYRLALLDLAGDRSDASNALIDSYCNAINSIAPHVCEMRPTDPLEICQKLSLARYLIGEGIYDRATDLVSSAERDLSSVMKDKNDGQ